MRERPARGFSIVDAPEDGAPTVAVRMTDVVLAYGEDPALVVDGLEVPAARITAVIGPNGSGKSTFLAAVSGLLAPASGTIEVFDHQPSRARRRVGHVLQETTTNATVPLTVGEVVAMGRYARVGMLGRFSDRDRDAVRRAMERVGVTDLERAHLTELSAGQRQRVYVAQGLAQEADLLLLDEPATGLDIPTQRRIADALTEERHAGRTVVYTTHDIGEASEADWVVLLAGHVVAHGSPDDVLLPDHLAAAYSGHLHVTAEGRLTLDDPHAHHQGGADG